MARVLYLQWCQNCHGVDGEGHNVMARLRKPAPASFASAAWQSSNDDDAIKTIILKGGSVAGKSAAMPPPADLAKRPAFLSALVRLIRDVGGPPLLQLKIDATAKMVAQVQEARALEQGQTFVSQQGDESLSFQVKLG